MIKNRLQNQKHQLQDVDQCQRLEVHRLQPKRHRTNVEVEPVNGNMLRDDIADAVHHHHRLVHRHRRRHR